MKYLNITGYKFVEIANPLRMRQHFRKLCQSIGIQGTMIVSQEGLNFSLAGTEEAVATFRKNLQEDVRFADLKLKASWSDEIPFRRLRIRVKDEIISMRVGGVEPEELTGKHLPAKQFKQWLDEKKDIWVLDTRNDYEVKVGTFEQAKHLAISTFREFPEKIKKLPDQLKEKPMVMFCTGGVRCEKAAAYCLENGFKEVYQLEDGIVKYFEDCGGEHWQGECFVFDDRVAVKPDLSPTKYKYCMACLETITEEDMKSDKFSYNKYCPHCYESTSSSREA